MSLAKTKQNNIIHSKTKVGQKIPHFFNFQAQTSVSIGHICAHDLGNQRTSPYMLDFSIKNIQASVFDIGSKSNTPKAASTFAPYDFEKHFVITLVTLSIANDTLSNDWEITFPSSSSSSSRLFLLLEDIASCDDTQERATLISSDL